MVRNILSKPSSKLNLTEQQTELFQDIILVGNNMSDVLRALDKRGLLPKEFKRLPCEWSNLMMELALMLIL